MATDPIELGAQARPLIDKLHGHNDIVLRFKTNKSGFAEDALTEEDEQANGGHYKSDTKVLAIDLDKVLNGKPLPKKLDSIEDFRQYPILAGVAAHEAGHARWSNWDELPATIPNPDYDEFEPTKTVTTTDPDTGVTTETVVEIPKEFPVSGNGELLKLASFLEEPRIERLGTGNYSKTWKKAMQFSAGHLILEQVDQMDKDDTNPLDSAVRLAVLVGGRMTAGTLGASHESREAVKKILDNAQEIIEKSVAAQDEPTSDDPYHAIMGIVNKQIFSNEHDNATAHLEYARQILAIVHPESKDNPDKKGGGEPGEDGEEPEGYAGATDPTGAMAKAMAEMKEGLDKAYADIAEMVESEEESVDKENTESSGHGSVLHKNPRAPQIARKEQPNQGDRDLYKKARDWMQAQIEPTVIERETSQWLPGGGARLNVRSWIRDNLAGHRANQRADWDRTYQDVKQAPPVKVGIMLDGSGSMGAFARPSASIAWAAANAAADLPGSRTVSVVYGNAAQVTQEPGHVPARTVNVSNTDGSTEAFIEAAQLVEEALWLDEEIEDGVKSNVLIIIVSDLAYGGMDRRTGEGQAAGFVRISQEWAEKGYRIIVVGADKNLYHLDRMHQHRPGKKPLKLDRSAFEVLTPDKLFID